MHHYLEYLGYLGDFKNSGNPVLVFLIPRENFQKKLTVKYFDKIVIKSSKHFSLNKGLCLLHLLFP